VTWDDREKSTEIDVDLEEEEIEIVVKETTTFSNLFDDEGKMKFWEDSGGWNGVKREDSRFYRVNVLADGEVVDKDRMSPEAVVESIHNHIEDPGAGSSGSWVAPSRPGPRRSDPDMWGDR